MCLWINPPITCSLENKKSLETVCPNKTVWLKPSKVLEKKKREILSVYQHCAQLLWQKTAEFFFTWLTLISSVFHLDIQMGDKLKENPE